MTPRRVTVIDDSPELIAVFDEVLSDEGVEVQPLRANATIHQIEASDPSLLVVDLRLGTDHLPGWEIIRQVRAHPRLSNVPIIVCSGALDQMHDPAGPGVGLPRTYLLPKPFSLHDLDAVLADALGSAAGAAPNARASGPLPDFSADPFSWFERVATEMDQPRWREVLHALPPASWPGINGRAWRVVRTSRGIEVRPELQSPFLRFGNEPTLTALGIGDGEVEVELTTQTERWVGRFSTDAFDVAALGRAMLLEQKLPHDNLSRLFPRTAAPDTDATVAIHVNGSNGAEEVTHPAGHWPGRGA